MTDDETKSTPKRKRDMDTPVAPITFSFDPTRTADDGDGSNSPRSRVAHRFRGLALGGGGGGGGGSGVASPDDDGDAARKRPRADAEMTDVPAPTVVTATDAEGKTMPQPQVARVTGNNPAEAKLPEGSLQKTYPSINRLSESKSRKGRRRTGTPPPRLRKKAAEAGRDAQDDDGMEIVVDPVRAALTWHEDEITIYDPDDADDDGTGINGVGFRPTPAMAHARLMKRRQQMAEYRRREESEARELRSQRRHGHHHHHDHTAPSSSSPEQSPRQCRKVKFMEDNNRTYLTTTP
ncbi:hypothetical protein ACRE_008550 [Hapsidospora chrysogenum ATCC 11550]|uniref:Uncharacterized protein n=1 Tax=Hapsidospora chrysogenum (strain ATCC 11550 / CBS 779.69 / DSM 880 / IAM 14645 / JCM 23072 / IMI 49137) TaxID=857340 RepID=A0A086TFZ1_HAPC1|nr:hypothetical protein ACRE_008550 [Hapsidospora chrysogenum ATCC 11550]